MKTDTQKKTGQKKPVRLIVFILIIIFNLIMWLSRPFSDWFTVHVFPLWGQTLGRFTSLFPFSVGEWMIIFGLLWLAVLALLWIIRGVILLPVVIRGFHGRGTYMGPGRRHSEHSDEPVASDVSRSGAHAAPVSSPYRARTPGYPYMSPGRKKSPAIRMLLATRDILLAIAVIMSLNCFVLYHCTPIDKNTRQYSKSELAAMRDLLVTECNERSAQIPRDASGAPVFAGDMKEEARVAVNALGERLFPRLKGYSVKPKTFYFSDFVSQQYMMGYYFPFSMEANINGRMEPLNKPFTMCHELSHTHGYIYEDEANLLGFLACLSSDDPAFVYSGYLGVLIYVDNDFYKTFGKKGYLSHVEISPQVWKDTRFLSDESWKEVEDNAVIDTETVKQAADTFIDQNQKLNGISDGKASYSRVVGLLLSYYSGEATYLR
ncbi:MAG: DUF3810 domain-containing protein [Lachnospiraceae bacterium]|nr:DUF3810 domain-containing protein [Lachnospiraceae bacterium]